MKIITFILFAIGIAGFGLGGFIGDWIFGPGGSMLHSSGRS